MGVVVAAVEFGSYCSSCVPLYCNAFKKFGSFLLVLLVCNLHLDGYFFLIVSGSIAIVDFMVFGATLFVVVVVSSCCLFSVADAATPSELVRQTCTTYYGAGR